MTEVPVIFPSHGAPPRRYVVNDSKKSIKRSQTKSGRSVLKPLPVLENSTIDALQRGCASVSSINLGLSPKPSILTTSSLAENPRILAVALSAGNNLNSPVLVELDLGTEIAWYSDTVKAQAFADTQKPQASIRLVLVAENAVVLTITLRPDDLSPSNVEVLDIRDLLRDEPAKSEVVSGAQLHKAMVAFYSKTCLVVALSPLLMAVNLDAGSAKVWLESQCLEEMKSRQSTIGTIFSKASDLLLGRLEEGVVDMPPTAAVCVSSTANPLFDPTFVFSLHSDGSIKRWTVNDTSLLPLEVQSITPLDMPMPNPRDWSDTYNSVYLTARLYEQVYVLAAHIQYSGSRGYESEEVSNSNLFVIHGGQDSSVQATVMSSQTLIVPVEATLLVDMGFVPTLSCCSLMAMFRSTNWDQSGSGRVLTITYPPSLVSIVSTEPEIAPIDNFLDGIAGAERARIEALAMSNSLEVAVSTNSYCVEDELHEVDSVFMKFLFRPAYPRGSGTVKPPLQHHIVNAIQKVVPGKININGEEGCKSVELETLQAMHEWRTRENRKLLSASPTKKARSEHASDPATPLDELTIREKESVPSVYASYVASALDIMENAELHDIDDDEEMSDADLHFGKDRTFLLEMHIRRWQRLLLAIWEEEQSLRSPLGLFLLDNSADESCSRAVLIRSGFTSILADSNVQKKSLGILERLDIAAIKLITVIESDKMCFKKLFSMEQRIWNQTARAQLDSLTPSDFAEEYSRLVDFAFDAARGAAFTAQEQKQLEQSLSKISLEEYSEWLQATPENSDLPWLSLMCGRSKPNQAGTGRGISSGTNQILNEQVRHAACALSVRCLESGRRLLLGRYLLVSYMVRSTSRLSTVAFYLYERLLAVLWVGSQHVGTHRSFVKGDSASTSLAQLGDEPPKKKKSYCDISGSIVSSSSSTTTCMDKLLISILQTRDSLTESESMGVVVTLGQEIFRSCLRSTVSTPDDVLSGKLARLMPELAALPPSTLQSVATDHPRFALRLIAPLVALSSAQDAPNVATARRETLAECLLVESNKQTSVSVMSRMRVRAFELLASSSKVAPANYREVGAAIETLKAANIGVPQLRQEDTENLCRNIQAILFGAEDEIRSETRRLVMLKSVKMFFTPLVKGVPEHLVADFDVAVKLLLPLFRCVSGLFHRVDILEHHFSKIRGSKDLVLDFIKSAIRELSDMFPLEFVERMPENLNLYNRLFDNAIAAKDFTLAYDASLDNPSSERKFWNLENMVISMVDGGYLGELLDKCQSTAHSSTDCVDLYSIAVHALEDSSCHSLYLMRAHSKDSSAAADFQGSLYALHVSRSQWRKAAQSLDLRFVNALHARELVRTGKSQDSESVAVRERLVVADLVLASIGAENALSLVDDTSAQFIVSGEYGHNHPIQSSSDDMSGIKRRRRPDANGDASEVEVSSFDRIRQVTGLEELEVRAAWSLAFRKLSLDSSVQYLAASDALVDDGSPWVGKKALCTLFDRGYYLCGLQLTMSKASPSSIAVGRNAFHECMVDLLGSRLVPLSIAGKNAIGNNASRPSLAQLRHTLDSVSWGSPFIIQVRSKKHSLAVDACAKALASTVVQKLTCLHTSADHPIGLDVANFFLEFDEKIFKIPHWLELLMVGDDAASAGGLFGRRPKPGCSRVYLGDPSALMTLYTSQGMLLEAVSVAVSVLAVSASRHEKPTTRLPENGNIDFVPYKKIDILWNLLQRVANDKDVTKEVISQLRSAQDKLMDALQKHFALMTISELGIRSARALGRNLA